MFKINVSKLLGSLYLNFKIQKSHFNNLVDKLVALVLLLVTHHMGYEEKLHHYIACFLQDSELLKWYWLIFWYIMTSSQSNWYLWLVNKIFDSRLCYLAVIYTRLGLGPKPRELEKGKLMETWIVAISWFSIFGYLIA